MTGEPARWTKATVYPDMWLDPADDPRETEETPEGELATLQDYLAGYRATILMKCEGLTPEQLARRSVPPSTMSLLGLIRHLAEVERDWRNWITEGEPLPKLYGPKDADFDGAAPDPSLVAAAFTDLAREQSATDAALAPHPLPARPAPTRTPIRSLHIHRIEEYARHAGHADLLRECVDGRVGQ